MNEKLKEKFDAMKAKTEGALLLFRIGDFYESYDEDAEVTADVLGITLTMKGDTKMAGFPRHSLDTYLPKLVRAGKRVAICDLAKETVEDVKPLVKRGETELSATLGEVTKIHINEIWPSPMNPRKTFDEEGICELADSIKQHGLLQPITVRPREKGHEIVMGERRFRAWQEICRLDPKFPREIPCIVRVMTDEEALDAMITENLQRKDVDPIEEAFAFGQLHAHGKSIEEIALRFGKSARFITERIKLDKLLPELKQWVTKGWMNIGAAMHLCKLTPEEQRKFFEEYTEEQVGDDTDPITKQDAIDFTDDLFMTIERADWDKDFEGSCGTTCAKCPFNNANVGCLFYEMKPHDATCTNRERWDTKRHSWLLNVVEQNADVLVKYGEDLEAGKTVVVAEPSSYYADRNPEYEPLIERIKEMGFEVVNKDDYFERFLSYLEGDERLKEKHDNNEVYRCLVVEQGWRGTEIHIRYFQFKKQGTEQSGDEVEAMQLVNGYKELKQRSADKLAEELAKLIKGIDPDELSSETLTSTERLVLLVLLARKTSHEWRSKRDIVGYGCKSTIEYVRDHKDEANLIFRDFIRNELSSNTWNTENQQCISFILNEWDREKADEVKTEHAAKLAKRLSKIEDQLTAIGYKTDGTKMEF